ncbi:ABC transporter substrate-binding protein, partial [Streptomyces sp. NPDC058953]|uniref:ABC transporter substrate-binding protein n=1 Tax=Streptomyces sp. NPDC058953 TaxID=3346676 RepID=UPI0036796800
AGGAPPPPRGPGRGPAGGPGPRPAARPGPPLDWLPDRVVSVIARRADAVLALPGIDSTLAVGGDTERRDPPGRRRVLALAAGGTALLAAGGGGALWWALRDRDEGPGAGAEPRRVIGVHADLSGPQKAEGIAQERAARLAAAEFNARADKPFTLSLDVVDDKGEAARAVGAARRLTGDPAVLAVLGPTGYTSAVAAVEVYERARLPLVSVSELSLAAAHTSLLAVPKWYYRAAPIRPYTAYVTMMAIAAQGARRPGMLIDRAGGFPRWELTFLAKGAAGNLGLDLKVRVVPERAEPAAVLGDMLSRGIDALYYTGTPERAAVVARALGERGFTRPRFLDASSATAAFVRAAGARGDGWQAITSHIGPGAARVRSFATAYRERYGSAPATGAAETYDAIRMLADRIAALKDGAGRRELGGALAGVRYKGLTQTFAYDESRLLKAEHVHHYRVERGGFGYVGPLKVPN